MRRVIIICEGQTEQEFCKDLLSPYFAARSIYLETPLIKKSKGGIIPWPGLRLEILNYLNQDRTATVTTLIDFYGIQPRHNFPGWEDSETIQNKYERIAHLENLMRADVESAFGFRFRPYIQLHEFESLLFINLESFSLNFQNDEFHWEELQKVLDDFPNPELINDTPGNAPSYRLGRIVKGYRKVVYDSILASSIGLENIRSKCPHFNEWIIKREV